MPQDDIRSRIPGWLADLLAALGFLQPSNTPPPTVTLSAPATAFTAPGTLALSGTLSGGPIARVELYRDGVKVGEIFNPTGGIFAFPPIEIKTPAQAGQYTAKAFTLSAASPASAPVAVTVDIAPPPVITPDTIAPTATLSASALSFTAEGTLTLTCAGSDDRGEFTLRLERDGLNIPIPENGVVTETITRASNGTHTYILIATDTAGNSGTDSKKVLVNLPPPPDVTPPVLSYFDMPNHPSRNITEAGNILFRAVATDDVAVRYVLFYRNNIEAARDLTGEPDVYEATLEFKPGTQGNVQIRARAYDFAGNFSDKTLELTVNIPADPPPGQPTQTVTYEAIPAYSLTNGDVTFTGRNFRSTAPGPAFQPHQNGGYGSANRLIFVNCIIRANGSAIKGFRCRLKLKNVILIIDPPTVAGQSAARPIDFQEFADWDMENVTIIGGGQQYASGSNGRFYGNPANGDGFKAKGIRFHNPDGRRSDGAGGYIKSNWGSTHTNNQARKDNGGIIGWDVANWIQFNGCPGMRFDVKWVEVLCNLGKARTEDTQSMYGGAGCSAAYPGTMEDCLLDTSGGFDWNYEPGVSTAYDASNQIKLNATGYQDVNGPRLSATAAIIGDAPRPVYDDNSAYITLRRVIGIGARGILGVNYGHDVTFDACQSYRMAKHWSGVPYTGYTDGFYQINPSTATGTLPGGGSKQIYGAIKLLNSIWGDKNYSGAPVAFDLSTAQLQGGGQSSGNLKIPAPADGGRQIIKDFRARAAAAGVTLGSTLPIPAELPAGLVADAFAEYA